VLYTTKCLTRRCSITTALRAFVGQVLICAFVVCFANYPQNRKLKPAAELGVKASNMEPSVLGKKYDKISQYWHERHENSNYGIMQFEKAVNFSINGGKALDVGCGTGGRFIRALKNKNYSVTGIDVSEEMIKLARVNHPDQIFLNQDICSWESNEKFNFIMAWDSIFHLPFHMQKPVISKLCQYLEKGGVLFYTLGNAYGEHTDQWHEDTFYYSSIGINENLKLLIDSGLSILHLELDQYPDRHVYVIATKP
jgi:SAM-dependent methyltransferase